MTWLTTVTFSVLASTKHMRELLCCWWKAISLTALFAHCPCLPLTCRMKCSGSPLCSCWPASWPSFWVFSPSCLIKPLRRHLESSRRLPLPFATRSAWKRIKTREKKTSFVQMWPEWSLTTRLYPSERSSPWCMRSAKQKREEEAHHPDCAVAGGVPVHVGRCWSFVDLLQDCLGYIAPAVQVSLHIWKKE